MIRGLYTSGWSMLANSKQMDVVSNNLANVNTTAFKKDTLILESFPDMLVRRINDSRSASNPSGRLGNVQLGNDVGEVLHTIPRGSSRRRTTIWTWLFQIVTLPSLPLRCPRERRVYRVLYKDGSFALNAYGQLVTKEGYLVMGQNGVITLNSENFSVSDDGTIIQDGEAVARLLIRNFTDTTTLRKVGSNLVQRTENTRNSPLTEW